MDGPSCPFFYLTTAVSRITVPRMHKRENLYCLTVIMTKPKEEDGITKYHVFKRVSFVVYREKHYKST